MDQDQLTPAPLMQMVTGCWIGKTLSVATDLEVFSRIAKRPKTAQEVAQDLGTRADPVQRLLDACVAMKLLTKDGERYKNSRLADAFLVKGRPRYFGDMLVWFGNQLYASWSGLKQCILENKPQAEHERRLFLHDPDIARSMTRAMHNNAIGPATLLAHRFDFSPYDTLLDVGGGSGAYSIIIAKEYPSVRAVIQDLPPVCEVAEEFVNKAGLSGRITTLSGDFFDIDLPRADVAILAQVLHSYAPDEGKEILKRIRECLAPKGIAIVVEFVLNEQKTGPLFPALFSLNMLLRTDHGRTYSGNEISSLLRKAGLVNIERIELTGPMGAFVAQKP